MKFADFITLCSHARFVSIQVGDDDMLTTVNVSASTEADGRFCVIGGDSDYDYVIRKEDVARAVPEGNGFKLPVLMADTEAERPDGAGVIVTYDEVEFLEIEATVCFLNLVEAKPAELLAHA